jgi:hypothetical protein
MTEQAAYEAFRTPSFQHALKTEMKVRRAASRAGNLPALERIRNSSKNPMAVVAAAKVIEQIACDGPQQANGERPGYVIAIPEHLMDRIGAAAQGARLPHVHSNALELQANVPADGEERASDAAEGEE